MRRPVEFWYDQFLAEPPGYGASTLWHQHEGYWGRNLDDLGITCWMPFHDVDPSNGCMHFIDGDTTTVTSTGWSSVQATCSTANQMSPAHRLPAAARRRTFHHSKTHT